MNETRYCIGEATQYQPMDIVKHPPLHPQQARLGNECDLIRSSIYYDLEHAEMACIEAAKCRSVNFVVLILAEPNSIVA